LRERSTGDVLSTTGEIDNVFRDIGDREIVAASASFARGMTDQNCGMLAFDRDKGVDLEIRKSDPDWSSQIAASVMAELEERRPYWSVLRTKAGRALCRLAVSTAAALVTLIIAWRYGIWWRTIAPAAVLVGSYVALSPRIFKRHIPGFEVTESGHSRVDRFLQMILVSVVVAFVVGIVVNLIT